MFQTSALHQSPFLLTFFHLRWFGRSSLAISTAFSQRSRYSSAPLQQRTALCRAPCCSLRLRRRSSGTARGTARAAGRCGGSLGLCLDAATGGRFPEASKGPKSLISEMIQCSKLIYFHGWVIHEHEKFQKVFRCGQTTACHMLGGSSWPELSERFITFSFEGVCVRMRNSAISALQGIQHIPITEWLDVLPSADEFAYFGDTIAKNHCRPFTFFIS